MKFNGILYKDEDICKAHKVFKEFRLENKLENEIINNFLIEQLKYKNKLEKENKELKEKLEKISNITTN
jgi:cell shape-determining protein MreC